MVLAVRVYWLSPIHLSVLRTKDFGRKLPPVFLCDHGCLRLPEHGSRVANQCLELAKPCNLVGNWNHWNVPYGIRAEEIHEDENAVGGQFHHGFQSDCHVGNGELRARELPVLDSDRCGFGAPLLEKKTLFRLRTFCGLHHFGHVGVF